jgi:hypothetical protein
VYALQTSGVSGVSGVSAMAKAKPTHTQKRLKVTPPAPLVLQRFPYESVEAQLLSAKACALIRDAYIDLAVRGVFQYIDIERPTCANGWITPVDDISGIVFGAICLFRSVVDEASLVNEGLSKRVRIVAAATLTLVYKIKTEGLFPCSGLIVHIVNAFLSETDKMNCLKTATDLISRLELEFINRAPVLSLLEGDDSILATFETATYEAFQCSNRSLHQLCLMIASGNFVFQTLACANGDLLETMGATASNKSIGKALALVGEVTLSIVADAKPNVRCKNTFVRNIAQALLTTLLDVKDDSITHRGGTAFERRAASPLTKTRTLRSALLILGGPFHF